MTNITLPSKDDDSKRTGVREYPGSFFQKDL